MKSKIISLSLIAVLFGRISFGQSAKKCDKIYRFVDKMPVYKINEKDFMTFFKENLAPIINNCYKRDSILISKINFLLTIDKTGKVVDSSIPKLYLVADSPILKHYLLKECEIELNNKILTMPKWSPGKLKGVDVCTYMNLPINCIKWDLD
jgi:hypothetical protein